MTHTGRTAENDGVNTGAASSAGAGSLNTVILRAVDIDKQEVHYSVNGRASRGTADLSNLTAGLPPVAGPAAELFFAATTAWLADRSIARRHQADRWSRRIEISFPVTDPASWPSRQLERLLRFISNDQWTVSPHQATTQPSLDTAQPWLTPLEADAVDLFSGGLDSYGHAVAHSTDTDTATNGRLTVGHWDMPAIRGIQERVHATLGRNPGLRRDFRVAAADTTEMSSRTRGLLFLSAAVAVAVALRVRLVAVPENGFVALNVPLTTARSGALSTRSTHPYTLRLTADVLSALGLDITIDNPWIYATKGDITRAALPHLDTVATTVSCSHPNDDRWRGNAVYSNCGHCYPCLVRRSGIEAANDGVDPTEYRYDPRVDETIAGLGSDRHVDLYAVVARLATPPHPRDLVRTATLPPGIDADRIQDMRERSHGELSAMLANGMTAPVRRRLGLS
jgi:hypothetical protein